MRPLKDAFFIEANARAKETIKLGGIELYQDTTWDAGKYKLAVQEGIVIETPHRISHKYENEHGHEIGFYGGVNIEKGDKVYFHHFVVQPENKHIIDNRELYRCEYSQIYCVIKKGQIVMVEDYLLAEPILEPEENWINPKTGLYLKPNRERIQGQCKITNVSKVCFEQGIYVGDTIVYKKDADYEMEIEGKKYFRMKAYNVAVKIDGDRLMPIRDTLVIKEHEQQNKVVAGIELVEIKKAKQQYATVLSAGPKASTTNFNVKNFSFEEYGINDTVIYHNGTAGYVEHNKVVYGVIEEGNVLGFISSHTSI